MAELADARRARELARIDPAHAGAYAPTPPTCGGELTRARPRRTPTGLADCARAHGRGLATTRSATSRKYGLRVEPIAGLSPDAEPTPADLARLRS